MKPCTDEEECCSSAFPPQARLCCCHQSVVLSRTARCPLNRDTLTASEQQLDIVVQHLIVNILKTDVHSRPETSHLQKKAEAIPEHFVKILFKTTLECLAEN